MTVALSGSEVANQVTSNLPEAVVEATDQVLVVKGEALFDVMEYLKNNPELDLNYLNYISAVDYYDYFELVYQLTSIKNNHI